MNPVLLNVLVPLVAMAALYGLWVSVHLLARLRLGDRRLGCRGAQMDEDGMEVCCHTGEPCEQTCEEEEAHREAG